MNKSLQKEEGRELKATGPRTRIGKQRSKSNATKHGVFSSVVVLATESQGEFNSLLEGLRQDYQPKGAHEAILVDKLAASYWRLRRLYIAENAEIQAAIRFPRLRKDPQSREQVIIRVVEEGKEETNLMQEISDPEILDKCLGLLRDLKLGIENAGLDNNRDSVLLTKLYGSCARRDQKPTLFDRYRTSLSIANRSEEERQQNGSASSEQGKKSFLEELEGEIKRLDRYKSVEADRIRLHGLRYYVPDSSQPDRLLRYETSLERNIDRTLSQLERLQRIRMGQPVPPKLEVQHSLS